MTRERLGRPILALGLLVLAVTGCGPGTGATVSGKVVLPAGWSFENEDAVEITLVPEDPTAKRSATASASGAARGTEVSFTAHTPQTKGVLPGRYKLGVRITPYPGMPGSEARKTKLDGAINRKYEATKGALSYEVTDGAQTITIDLGKGTVTKN
jgi:hypothetical protein